MEPEQRPQDEKRPGKGGRAGGAASKAISHNLNGQRLGRKGRDTRERILAATSELLAGPPETPFSLSAVARQASLGMTSLYVYFKDLTELLLAALEPVMATAESEYVCLLRDHWADDELGDRAAAFVNGYHAFWVRNSRLLHLRNSMADQQDEGMLLHRVHAAQPLIRLIVQQMGDDLDRSGSMAFSMATALMTGLERVVTVTTDDALQNLLHTRFSSNVNLLHAEARLLEMGIREHRTPG